MPPAVCVHVAGPEMQRREAGARRDRQQESRAAPEHRPALGQLLMAKQEDAGDQHEHREQVRRLADEQERKVREPGARGTHAVSDTAVAARDAERGVDGAVAQEREQQDHAQAREDPERGLAKPSNPRNEEAVRDGGVLRLVQAVRQ